MSYNRRMTSEERAIMYRTRRDYWRGMVGAIVIVGMLVLVGVGFLVGL